MGGRHRSIVLRLAAMLACWTVYSGISAMAVRTTQLHQAARVHRGRFRCSMAADAAYALALRLFTRLVNGFERALLRETNVYRDGCAYQRGHQPSRSFLKSVNVRHQ
jgi:hypothetical protein